MAFTTCSKANLFMTNFRGFYQIIRVTLLPPNNMKFTSPIEIFIPLS
jgi:hypothetical protein